MWKKTPFHFVYCHIEEIPGWATDGRVHKCILKYAYEIGSDTEISGFDVFVVQFGCWPYFPRTNNIPLNPVDTEETMIFLKRNMQSNLKYLSSVG